jgi:hypothetical protein
MMAGAAITAPLIAAYKEAGKYNADISRQLNETKNVFQNLSVSIGTALLPVMRQLTDQTAMFVDWWKNLDKATQEKIIINVFNLGKAFVALGTAFMVIGKSISFLGNLALLASNLPMLTTSVGLTIAAIGGLVIAMIKWQVVCDFVVNTLEVMGAVIGQLIDYTLLYTKAMSGNFKDVKKYWEDIKSLRLDIQNILAGKNGITANALDKYRAMFTNIGDMWGDLAKKMTGGGISSEQPEGTFFSGFRLGLEQTRQSLESWRDMGLKASIDLSRGMQASFKSVFVDAFSGQLKKASDYFAAFGNKLIDIFADVCAQILEQWAIIMIMTGLGEIFGGSIGGSIGRFAGQGISQGIFGSNNFVDIATNTVATPYYHRGGIIRAHGGLNLASDEVPIIAQTGERVLSRSQNREYERGENTRANSTVIHHHQYKINIQAMDSQSFVEYCKSNPGGIEAIARATVGGDSRKNAMYIRRLNKGG